MHIPRANKRGVGVGLLALLLMACATAFGTPVLAAETAPQTGHPAPAFSAADTDGKSHALSDFKGRPVTVLFMCGCEWCGPVADLWGQMQRGGALPNGPDGKPLPTVLVFSGDTDMTRNFANQHGLNLSQTVLLPDPEMKVTFDIYHVDPCPRAYVVDSAGTLTYTNNHGDDAARKAPALAIVSRTVDALRAAAGPQHGTAKPAASGKKPPHGKTPVTPGTKHSTHASVHSKKSGKHGAKSGKAAPKSAGRRAHHDNPNHR